MPPITTVYLIENNQIIIHNSFILGIYQVKALTFHWFEFGIPKVQSVFFSLVAEEIIPYINKLLNNIT